MKKFWKRQTQPQRGRQTRQNRSAVEAAFESARHAKRAVTVAWVSAVVNLLVVATAFFVPTLQRRWAESDRYVDQRRQDIRVIDAAFSEVGQIALILSRGAILDPAVCDEKANPNAYDRTRLKSIQNRLASLNQVIFQDGVTSSTQVRLQAGMIRLHDALDNVVITVNSPRDRSMPIEDRKLWCLSALSDLALQTKTLQSEVKDLVQYAYLPINNGLFSLAESDDAWSPMRNDITVQIQNTVVPDITDPAMANEAK